MSLEYAESRIKEALKLAKGNPLKARQKIIAWSLEDQKLLYALARPHLTGIVAHAMDRVINRQKVEADLQDVPETAQPINMKPATFGQQLLGALQSNNTARFGQESSAPPIGRKKASREHVEALRRLARKPTGNE